MTPNLRFATIITGCMLIGAAGAAYYRTQGIAAIARPAAPAASLAEAPTAAAWPPSTSVAYLDELLALASLSAAPAATVEAATPPAASDQVAAGDPAPQAPPATTDRPTPRATADLPTPQRPRASAGNPAPKAAPSTAPKRRQVATNDPAPQAATGNNVPEPQSAPAADADAGDQPTSPRVSGAARPPRATNPPARTNEMVEVVIRDRFGRPVRVERVARRRLAGPDTVPPPPYDRPYGAYGYGAHGHGAYGYAAHGYAVHGPQRLYHTPPHGPHGRHFR
jgi:hypothetical protein